MRRQLSFCSVLLPHHPQHHLRSFHQIGSAVHAAFLYVSVRLFFCHMIPFHQNRFRFSYLLLLPAAPFCGNGSALSAASFHILHHHIHGINQFMDFQRHRHRQAATAPIFLQDMPGGQQKQFKPVRKILRKFRNIISGRRQPHRTIPSRSPSAWLIAAAPVVQTATTWCPLRTRTLFTFPASSLLEKATIMPVNGPHLSSLPDSQRLWL